MSVGGYCSGVCYLHLLSCLLVGTVLVSASCHLLSCLLVVTVLVSASRHLLSCLLVGTVLVSATFTCCHVCWWVLFRCLLPSPVVMSVGGYCSGVC